MICASLLSGGFIQTFPIIAVFWLLPCCVRISQYFLTLATSCRIWHFPLIRRYVSSILAIHLVLHFHTVVWWCLIVKIYYFSQKAHPGLPGFPSFRIRFSILQPCASNYPLSHSVQMISSKNFGSNTGNVDSTRNPRLLSAFNWSGLIVCM